MAKYTNVFLKGRMNKDLDERVIQKGEYRDAKNIEISTSEDSDVGAVQNIKGNLLVTKNTYDQTSLNVVSSSEMSFNFDSSSNFNPTFEQTSDYSFEYNAPSTGGIDNVENAFSNVKLALGQIIPGQNYFISFTATVVFDDNVTDPTIGYFGVESVPFTSVYNSAASIASIGTSLALGADNSVGTDSVDYVANFTATEALDGGGQDFDYISFAISTNIQSLSVSNIIIQQINSSSSISSDNAVNTNSDNATTVGSYTDEINDKIYSFINRACDFNTYNMVTSAGQSITRKIGVRSDAILEYSPNINSDYGITKSVFTDVSEVRVCPYKIGDHEPNVNPTTGAISRTNIYNLPTTAVINPYDNTIMHVPIGIKVGMRVQHMNNNNQDIWGAENNYLVTSIHYSSTPNTARISITSLSAAVSTFDSNSDLAGHYLKFTAPRVLNFKRGITEVENNTELQSVSITPENSIITAINYDSGFLYFTDGRNEPKKIPVDRFRSGTYNVVINTKSYDYSFLESINDGSVSIYGGLNNQDLITAAYFLVQDNENIGNYVTKKSLYDVKERHCSVIKQNPNVSPEIRLQRKKDYITVQGWNGANNIQPTTFDGVFTLGEAFGNANYDFELSSEVYRYSNITNTIVGKANVNAGTPDQVVAEPFTMLDSDNFPLQTGVKFKIKSFTDRINFRVGDTIKLIGQTSGNVVFVDIVDSVTVHGYNTFQIPYFSIFEVQILNNGDAAADDAAEFWSAELDVTSDFYTKQFVSFAYRYKYLDNEISCISPYSKPAFIPGLYDYSSKTGFSSAMENSATSITISDFISDDIPEDVKEVELLIKDHSFGNVFAFKTINTSSSDFNSKGIIGRKGNIVLNSEINGVTLSGLQLDRVFDAVPITAEAQSITASRIMYGNYEENYDISNTNNQLIKPNYELSHITAEPNVEYSGLNSNILFATSAYAGEGVDGSASVEKTGALIDLNIEGVGYAIPESKFFNLAIDADLDDGGFSFQDIHPQQSAAKKYAGILLNIRPEDIGDHDASSLELPGLIDPGQSNTDMGDTGNYQDYAVQLNHHYQAYRDNFIYYNASGGAVELFPRRPFIYRIPTEGKYKMNASVSFKAFEKYKKDFTLILAKKPSGPGVGTYSHAYAYIPIRARLELWKVDGEGFPTNLISTGSFSTKIADGTPGYTIMPDQGVASFTIKDGIDALNGTEVDGEFHTSPQQCPHFGCHQNATLSFTLNTATSSVSANDYIGMFLVFEKQPAFIDNALNGVTIPEYYFQSVAGSTMDYGDGNGPVPYNGPYVLGTTGPATALDFSGAENMGIQVGIKKQYAGGNYYSDYYTPHGFEAAEPQTWNIYEAPVGTSASSSAVGFESVKSNASYQLGIVYRDKHGRESTVQIDEKASTTINLESARNSNILLSKINSAAPSWAESFKFFVKDNGNKFYNIVLHKAYDNQDGDLDDAPTSIWLSFNSSERSKIDLDDILIAKKKHGSNEAASSAKFKILDISNQVPSGSGGITSEDSSEDDDGITVSGSDANGKFFVKVNYAGFRESVTTAGTDSAFFDVFTDDATANGAVFEIRKKFSLNPDTLDPKQGFYWEVDKAIPIELTKRFVYNYIEKGMKISLHSIVDQAGNDYTVYVDQWNDANNLYVYSATGADSIKNDAYLGWGTSGANERFYYVDLYVGNQEVTSLELMDNDANSAIIANVPFDSTVTLRLTDPRGNYVTIDAVRFSKQVIRCIPFTHPNEKYNSSREMCVDWHNCYGFSNGVESDTISESFIENSLYAYTASNKHSGFKANQFFSGYGRERKENNIIFSQIINEDNNINGSNQFILADSITKKLSKDFGPIRLLYTRDNDVISLCEDKTVKILSSGKNALFNADGNSQLIASSAVLGQAIPYAGDYGCQNPESFAYDEYRSYFIDKSRKTAIRLSRDGITPISDFGMKDWFNDNISHSSALVGSFDGKKEEYNITVHQSVKPGFNKNMYTLSFHEPSNGWVSFKSFIQEQGVSLNNKYYTFKNGLMYLHHPETIVNRNLFYSSSKTSASGIYAVQAESGITAIINDSSNIVKDFKTLSYEGSQSRIIQNLSDSDFYNLDETKGWYVESINTDLQEGEIKELIDKEGKWHNYIKGAASSYTNFNSGITSGNNLDVSESTVQGVGSVLSTFMAEGTEPTQGFNVTIDPGDDATWTSNDVIIYNVASVTGTVEILIVPMGGFSIAANMFGTLNLATNQYELTNDGSLDGGLWTTISFVDNGAPNAFNNTVTGTLTWAE